MIQSCYGESIPKLSHSTPSQFGCFLPSERRLRDLHFPGGGARGLQRFRIPDGINLESLPGMDSVHPVVLRAFHFVATNLDLSSPSFDRDFVADLLP